MDHIWQRHASERRNVSNTASTIEGELLWRYSLPPIRKDLGPTETVHLVNYTLIVPLRSATIAITAANNKIEKKRVCEC